MNNIMNKMSEQKHHKNPQFGHHLGIWYPFIWRLLGTNRFWSPSMWLPRESALAIDIYIGVWWLLEIVYLFCWKEIGLLGDFFTWLVTILSIFRLTDIMFVLLSIIVKGNYRREGDWPSVNRVILLVILNSIEVMFLFGVLYYLIGILFPEIASVSENINNLFDGLYFSFVTGTSLGYGVPHPTGWLSKFFSVAEATSVILIIITVFGYITGVKKNQK